MTDTRMTGDRPLRQQMLAVHSIGAGGGSIVQQGAGGLSVGPHSAGVEPGPACYGRGGLQPTITDANAILGYLDPGAVLGAVSGQGIRVGVEKARAAVAPIAAALGLDVVDTALGILQVANATMARALRRVTVERGVDGRDCTLLAFGGGGPMHAAGLADIYGLSEIIIPAASSAFSALGCLTADQSFVQQQTVRLPLTDLCPETLGSYIEALRATTTAPLLASGSDTESIRISYVAMMRYEAQSDTTAVPFGLPLDAAALHADFQVLHHKLFGYSTGEPCVIEGLRAEARVPSRMRPAMTMRGQGHAPRRRICSFAEARDFETAILSRDNLASVVHGPAIIADAWSTVVVPPGWLAMPEPGGHLRMMRRTS